MTKMTSILDEVEALGNNLAASDPKLYKESEGLFDHMADAVAFGEALNALFVDNGLIEATEEGVSADFSTLENTVDSLFIEMFAAVFILSSMGPQVPAAIREIAGNLGDAEDVPNQLVAGYELLAERVEATRVAREQLEEALTQGTENEDAAKDSADA